MEKILNVGSEDMPYITKEEIRNALSEIKNGNCPGEDIIMTEIIKLGGTLLEKYILILSNKCVHKGRIPDSGLETEVILLFKKGDPTKL